MLPQYTRLRRSDEFRSVTRGGVRAGRRTLVVHALRPPADGAVDGPRIGFIVSKAVGNSVVRHRVTRQLRHLLRYRLSTLPRGATLVVRALPASRDAGSGELGKDLDSALRRLALVTGRDSAGE